MWLFFRVFQGFNIIFSKSYYSYEIDTFHNFNCCLLLSVLLFVTFLFIFLIFNFSFFKIDGVEYQLGELLCSILPVLILVFQMLPSLGLLYIFGLMDFFSDVSLKVTGHQWYWSYSYRDFDSLDFDSYFKLNDSLYEGDFRLLDVDNRCVLPINLRVFFSITSRDVIHSWALFNIGLKLDAIRGILRTFYFKFPIVGLYFGQCSEICGANHSFIPIVLELVGFFSFKNWCLLF